MAELKLQVILSAVNNMTAPINAALKSTHALSAGISMLSDGMGALIDEAAKYQTITEKFNQYGMGAAALKDAEKFVAAQKIIGVSRTEMMTYFTEAQGVFRESGAKTLKEQLEAAKMAAPTLAKINMASKGLDEHTQGLLHDQQMDMLRFTEQMGGLKSPKRFNEIMSGGFKAIQSSGGNVNWEQYRQFVSKAGSSAFQLSDKTLFAKLEPIIGEMKGGAAGDALMSSFSRLHGIVKNKAAAHKLADMGIWNEKGIVWDALGGVKKFVPGVKLLKREFSDMLSTDPVNFYKNVILPKYKSKALSDNDIMIENSIIFGRQGGKMFNLIHKQMEVIDKSVKAFDKARGIDDAYNAIQKTYAGQKMALDAKWKDFELSLGKDSGLLDIATKVLKNLSDGVTYVTALSQRFPHLTLAILATAGALIAFKAVAVGGGFFIAIIKDIGMLARTIYAALLPALQAVWAVIGLNPFTMFAIAAAAAALLIYRNWQPIKAFIGGLFEGFAPLKPLFSSIASSPIWQWISSGISSAINWFKQLFLPIQYTKGELNNAANAGRNMGAAIANGILSAISAVKSVIAYISNLHGHFVNYGSMMMTGLANGISAGIGIVRAKIAAVAASVKSSFTGLLGIHSPSRVFMDYGVNINHGLAAGLQQQTAPMLQMGNLTKNMIKVALPVAGLMAAPAMAEPAQSSFAYPQSNTSQTITYHQNITIQVTAPEGSSPEMVAKLVEKRFREQSRSRNGQLFDGDY